MFKKHSFNIRVVKDQPAANDVDARAANVTDHIVISQAYAHMVEKTADHVINTITAAVVGVALVRTACAITFHIVKRIV